MAGYANNEPYALHVPDSSIEPEFPKGCVIVSEPNGVPENGSAVTGFDGNEPVLCQLLIFTPTIDHRQAQLIIHPHVRAHPVSPPVQIAIRG